MLRADYPSFIPPTESVPADGAVVTIPDAHLLFSGQFSRTAHDLILTGEDGTRFLISGYFDRADPPALTSPDGAMLRPDAIAALAGPLAPGQYAQAGGGGAGGGAIGKVSDLSGTVTAQHADGTTVQLNVGDAVFQGDVLQSGPQSSLGIVFADDTVFSLSANARMVLNELVYQQGGSDNSMTFSLVEGTFSFVAGKVAPSGEMKINTPVASMGIRGTTVFTKIAAIDGKTLFQIVPDPGTNKVGAYQLLSLVDGSVLATVNSVDLAYSLASATGQPEPVSGSQLDQVDQDQIQKLYDVYEKAVQSGDIQGASDGNDNRQGSNGGSSSEQTAVATETPGDTQALGAGAGTSLAALASEPLAEAEAAVEDGEAATTEADAAVTAEPASGEPAAPEPRAPGPPPPPTETPPLTPVDGTATENGASNTLDALANAPAGSSVTGLPPTLPAGVTYDTVNQTFTLNPNDPAYDSLAAGGTATVTVNYGVNNGATTTPASVRWVVTGVNDAPVATDDGTLATNENTALNGINVLANDSDVDGDTLSIAGTPTALHGTVTVNPNGTLNYTPNTGYAGPDTITYQVSDGTVSDIGEVAITVNTVNDAPVAVDDGPLATDEDTPLSNIDVLGNDTDAENDTLAISGTPTALHGSVTVNLDGTLNYTPNANYNGPDTITYTVTDGTSTDTGQVAITVNAASDAPSIDNLNLTTTSVEQVPAVIDTNVSITDGDLDALNGGAGNYAGSTLTVVRTGGADAQDAFSFSTSGASFVVVGSTLRVGGNVIANFSTTGNSLTIAFTSLATSALVDNVVQHIAYANTSDTPPASIGLDFSFNDGTTTVTESITVNITDANEIPIANPDNVITNIASGPIAIPELALIGNDTDADGGTLDVADAGGASGGAVSHSPGSGTGGSVSFTDTGAPGGSFTYTVTDGTSTSAAATVTVTRDTTGALDGTSGADILIAANGGTTLIGHGGDDRLVGGVGADTYVWSLNDGYDTILPNGTGANQDIIQINGTFYDYNWTLDGDDLILGVAADDNYDFADVGGSIRIESFLSGNDSIAYLVADLGPNNIFYSPGGGDARIYVSAVNGTDQGNYFELTIGTSGDDVMTDIAGTGQNRLWGGDGNDTISVTGVTGVLIGGNGDDTLTGGEFDDQLRGADGSDALDGGDGIDIARYDRPAGSAPITSGAFVNLSGDNATYDFDGTETTVAAGAAIDNYGNTDTLSNIEDLRGSAFDDVIIGTAGANTLFGLDGDDVIVGGGNTGSGGVDVDYIFGGGGADSFAYGTETGEIHIEDFELGTDVLRFQGDVSIASLAEEDWGPPWGLTTIVTLNTGATIALVSVSGVTDAAQLLAPAITGTTDPDTLTGTVFNDTIEGGQGDDALTGRAGIDTYVWSAGDGYDTIFSTGSGGSEDVIKINGTFYDFDWQPDGSNDLVVGAVADDSYDFATTGGSLRLKDFRLPGNDSIAYLEIDVGPSNQFYSPDGGNARIYLNLVTGEDQGNYFELIQGTHGDDIMTDAGGAGVNWFGGGDGNDTITAAAGTFARLNGGNGDDILTGANLDDELRGSAGNDVMDGGDGEDTVRYNGFDGSPAVTSGAFVNLSGSAVTMDFNGDPTTVQAGEALDSWGDTDTLSNIENVRGSNFDDIIIGDDGANWIRGMAGDDTLMGRGGADLYEWRINDGYDTILSDGGGPNEDVIRIEGTFYDYNWEAQGDDLLVGIAVDENYNWADAGGNLRIKDFFAGGDTIDYLSVDLGPDNNNFYSPGGGEDARIYLSAVNGTDQGNYFETIIGTSGNDNMTGGGGAIDWFNARGGDDTMSVSVGTRGFFRAGDGADNMTGADMDDQFIGGIGNDTMNGGLGIDEVRYDRRADSSLPLTSGAFINLSGIAVTMTFNSVATTVQAGEALDNWGGTDSLSDIEQARGSDYADIIIGSGADNRLNGLAGADKLFGGAGDDEILGGAGNDELSGEDDNDILQGYAGDDQLFGGDGVDAADYYDDPNGVTVNLAAGTASDGYGGTDTLVDMEQIYGSFHDDVLTGNSGDNWIEGRGGHDEIHGGAGNDELLGGDGDDQLYGGNDRDLLEGGAGNDLLDGGGGQEDMASYYNAASGVTVDLGAGTASDDGDGGSDTLVGIERLFGSFHADSLTGDGGVNYMTGSAGDDFLDGSGGQDVLDYSEDPGGVTVNFTTGIAIDGFGDTDTLQNFEEVIGSLHDDELIGNDGDNLFEGRGGNDIMDGDDGFDYVDYFNDPGGVTVDLSTGSATDGYGGGDTLLNIEGILASFNDDTLTGTGAGNYIEARAGNDGIYMPDVNGATVKGGVGQDTLVITGSGVSIDLTGGGIDVSGIETFDLTGTYDNSLTLSGQNVVDIGESNTDFSSATYAENLVVEGDAGDQVTLAGGIGGWVLFSSGTTLDGSGSGDYDVYNYSESGVTASLAVDQDVAVTIA